MIAKEIGAPYRPGERTGMVKIKRVRTIDAVVMGWRPGKAEGTVGALILGLHDARRRACARSGTPAASPPRRSASSSARLAPYETGERGSGEPSRWTAGRDLEWVALRPELVVEVTFDHVSDGRIRHGAKVQRWREDKAAGRVHLRSARRADLRPVDRRERCRRRRAAACEPGRHDPQRRGQPVGPRHVALGLAAGPASQIASATFSGVETSQRVRAALDELRLREALGRDEARQHEADVDAVRALLEVQRVGPAGERELRRR